MSPTRSAAPLPPLQVGGQAVLEGVMMRSPRSFVVVCRRPDQKIVIKEAPWVSVWDRLRFLRLPVLRGGVVFWETLQNGLQALSFSAQQQVVDPEQGPPLPAGEGSEGEAAAAAARPEPEPAAARSAPAETGDAGTGAGAGPTAGGEGAMSKGAIAGTIVFSLALAFLLFAALPHLLAFVTGQVLGMPLDGKSVTFHVVDAVFKLAILVGYMWGISRMKEIQRVFMYHGAEHKAIFTYEAGEPLTVANARKYTTHHPRCGTSFLLLVILVSIAVFTGVFSGPWMPEFSSNRWLNQAIYVLIKLPLMFPIAGIAYEVLKLSGRRPDHGLLRPFIVPGLWLQHITTREPTDDMLEIALLSLRKVLWREAMLQAGERTEGGACLPGSGEREPEIYDSVDEVDLPLALPEQAIPAAAARA